MPLVQNEIVTLWQTSVIMDKRPTNISPELQAFAGIAKTTDQRDWKERKEEYLSMPYKKLRTDL